MSEEYTEVELRREAMTLALQSGVEPSEQLDKAEEIYQFLIKRDSEQKQGE